MAEPTWVQERVVEFADRAGLSGWSATSATKQAVRDLMEAIGIATARECAAIVQREGGSTDIALKVLPGRRRLEQAAMTAWAWLREKLGLTPPAPPGPPEPVMHLLGPGLRPVCGVEYGPAAPITVELHMVRCEACLVVGRRRQISVVARRR